MKKKEMKCYWKQICKQKV